MSTQRTLALLVSAALASTAALTVLPSASAYPGCGTADIAQGRSAAASSNERGDLGPAKAFDGDSGTRWGSSFTGDQAATADTQSLQVDLGSSRALCGVDLVWDDAAYASGYQVQVSDDGNTWRTVYTVTKGKGGTESPLFAADGRYVRLQGIKRASGYGISLSSMRVHAPDGSFTPPAPSDPPAGSPTPPTTPTPAPPPANPGELVTHHEFQANCVPNHTGPDDPILYPGQPGRSHNHTFMGNVSTDAYSTPASLLATGTSCTVPQDRSAYWFPTLFKGGKPVVSDQAQTIYYKSGIEDYASVVPFPAGLQFIAGDMMATTEEFRDAPGAVEGFECGDSTKNWSFPKTCPNGSQLDVRYQAPSCWDGKNLKAADGKSNMAYPVRGSCPAGYPVAVPMLEFKTHFPVDGDLSDVKFASGAGSSWHYDFVNAWDPDVLSALVEHCINGGLQCNPRGFDQYKPGRGTVLDESYHLVNG